MDLIYIGITGVLFVATCGLVQLCAALGGKR